MIFHFFTVRCEILFLFLRPRPERRISMSETSARNFRYNFHRIIYAGNTEGRELSLSELGQEALSIRARSPVFTQAHWNNSSFPRFSAVPFLEQQLVPPFFRRPIGTTAPVPPLVRNRQRPPLFSHFFPATLCPPRPWTGSAGAVRSNFRPVRRCTSSFVTARVNMSGSPICWRRRFRQKSKKRHSLICCNKVKVC